MGNVNFRHLRKLSISLLGALLVFICIRVLIVGHYSYYNQSSYETGRDPVIECTEEDATDTPFISQLKQNDTVTIPPVFVLNTLSREELSALYHRYVNNIQFLCKRRLRLGALEDGGWDLCAQKDYIPREPCLVYSVGINNDFSFDDDVALKLGCEVHSFDPSMGQDEYRRSDKIFFHNVGLAGLSVITDTQWQLLSYSDIRTRLGHDQRAVSVVKLDIEQWEWDVLADMVTTGDLTGLTQFMVELHLALASPEQERSVYLRALAVLRDIHQLGFRIFSSRTNSWCAFKSKCKGEARTNCHELGFVMAR